MTVEVDQAVLDGLTQIIGVELLRIAETQVVPAAQGKAPKKTGEGAGSIHAEAHSDVATHTPVVRIGWDADHFYMLFAEKGTERQPAHPFLRPALDAAH